MKNEFDLKGASVYKLNPVPVPWFRRKNGKNLKQRGKTWSVDSIGVRSNPLHYANKNRYEIYPLAANDNSRTYWLVEHRIIDGTGKIGHPGTSGLVGIIGQSGNAGNVGMVGPLQRLECVLLYQVELVKQAANNKKFWVVKRLNEKKL